MKSEYSSYRCLCLSAYFNLNQKNAKHTKDCSIKQNKYLQETLNFGNLLTKNETMEIENPLPISIDITHSNEIYQKNKTTFLPNDSHLSVEKTQLHFEEKKINEKQTLEESSLNILKDLKDSISLDNYSTNFKSKFSFVDSDLTIIKEMEVCEKKIQEEAEARDRKIQKEADYHMKELEYHKKKLQETENCMR